MRYPSIAALAFLLAVPSFAQDTGAGDAKAPQSAPGGSAAAQDVKDHLELKKGGAVVFQKAGEADAAPSAPAQAKAPAKKPRYKGYHKDKKRKEAMAKYEQEAMERIDAAAAKGLEPAKMEEAKQAALDKEINEDVKQTLAEELAKSATAEDKARREAQMNAAKSADGSIDKRMAKIEAAAGKKLFKEKGAEPASSDGGGKQPPAGH